MQYEVIVADPPWSFKDTLSGPRQTQQAAIRHYDVMTSGDIIGLDVKSVAAEDSVLMLWVPSALIAEGLATVAAWGFDYKQLYIWEKTQKDGVTPRMLLGRTFRNCFEVALFGKRGRPQHASKSELNLERHPALRHSAKPEGVQDRLERLYPDANKLELFARRVRPGWTCTGLECPATPGQDIRDWLSGGLQSTSEAA